MGKRTNSSLIHKQYSTYFTRYAYPIEYLGKYPVAEKLRLLITIPCYNEPDLTRTLEGLYACRPTSNPVEIIVLINQSVNVSKTVSRQNEYSYKEAVKWAEDHNTLSRKFHIIFVKDIPNRHFGVGLARKIVMDEAVRRLVKTSTGEGIIAGLDADSLIDGNYLFEIEQFFHQNPYTNGTTIYFEHPLYSGNNKILQLGIASYELHLRYLIQALRHTCFPYAFHTLGSSMAIRASVYVKQGGMNKRKAGEDFHFLHKIIPLGNFGEINRTRVIPSGRISDRVPFGTGKAMMKWSDSKFNEFRTYNPLIFEELHTLLSGIDELFTDEHRDVEDYYQNLSGTLKKFLKKKDWMEKIAGFRRQSASVRTFRYKFFQWMNGLNILKYVHFARDKKYRNVPVLEAYTWLRTKIKIAGLKPENVFDALSELRSYEKSHPHYYTNQ